MNTYQVLLQVYCRVLVRPFDAKERQLTSSGRSPDFWLQALLISPSHHLQDSGYFLSDKLLTSYSSATVSDFHRLPYSA